MAGRPPGAQNRDKPFRDALRAEIAAATDDNDYKSLRRIARRLLEQAASGDVVAIREIADRIGKVPTPVGGANELGPIAQYIVSDKEMTSEEWKVAYVDNGDEEASR